MGVGRVQSKGDSRQEKNPRRMSEDGTKERGGGLMRKKRWEATTSHGDRLEEREDDTCLTSWTLHQEVEGKGHSIVGANATPPYRKHYAAFL